MRLWHKKCTFLQKSGEMWTFTCNIRETQIHKSVVNMCTNVHTKTCKSDENS